MSNPYAALLTKVRETAPLVHHITNYVTVNDCANITLGIGAAPVMADAIGEASDIAAIASSLVLNMGTLNDRTIASSLAAGKSANARGVPVIFDPVGAGASQLRNDTVAAFTSELQLSVIRGNISEIRFVAGLSSGTRGVDASAADSSDIDSVCQMAAALASRLRCVVVVSGATDVVADGSRLLLIENGHPMLSRLTGTGCMCTSLIGSFCGAAGDAFSGAAAAMLCMGIAGEIAFERSGALGNGSFHTALHDAISLMDAPTLERKACYREG